MSRRCELTGVGPMVGNNVSHSNIKTKRRFLPALAPVTLQSESLGQSFKLKVSNAALRTLDVEALALTRAIEKFNVEEEDRPLALVA